VRLRLRGYRGPGIWDYPITRHHQIHPAKLATDLTAELVSVALIWQRRYVLGLVAHLVPPIVASAVLTRRTADLKRLRDTRAGRHVRSEMTPPIVALRVIGDVLTVVGPWRHRPAAIAAGALLVLARIHRTSSSGGSMTATGRRSTPIGVMTNPRTGRTRVGRRPIGSREAPERPAADRCAG
jgi:hypothetical protein